MQTDSRKKISDLYKRVVTQFCAVPPVPSFQYVLRSTSGTSGSAPLHAVYRIVSSAFARHARTQRLLIAIAPRNARLLNMLLVRYGDEKGQKIMCLDGADVEHDIGPLLEDATPDGLFGSVSFVVRIAGVMSEKIRKSIPGILVTSEYVTPAQYDFLAQQFPDAAVSQVYATTETAQISLPPCGNLPLNSYHIVPDIDIRLHEVDETGVGMVTSSWDIIQGVHVDRYFTGDVGRLSHEPCVCGEKTTLTLMGRSGFDHIKLAGALLHRVEFDRVALLCKDMFDEYRAVAYTTENNGEMCGGIALTVYRKTGPLNEAEKSELAERFSAELFLTPNRTLADLVERGIFVPITVESVREPFVQSAKEVKLTRRA